MYKNEWRLDFRQTAADCNAQSELPLPLIIQRIIDIATYHANHLNIGFDRLEKENKRWVLTRLTIEMNRHPRIGEEYSMLTWLESFNRHFSERNMAFITPDGEALGYIRTVWSIINKQTRMSEDIPDPELLADVINPRPCPIEKFRRMKPIIAPEASDPYRFRYCDTDFNRHVNSGRYVELILNHFPLEFFDNNRICRLELAYMKECYCGDEARADYTKESENSIIAEISVADEAICRARITFDNPIRGNL